MITPPMGPDPKWQHVTPEQNDIWLKQKKAGPQPALLINPPPALGIPRENRGDAAADAVAGAGYGVNTAPTGIKANACEKSVCLPNPAGYAWDVTPSALKGNVDRPEATCACWSDIWFYGGGTVLALLGLFMLFGGGSLGSKPSLSD